MNNCLEIQKLSVIFHTDDGNISAVRDLSMSIGHGEIIAVVGESGCGKSVLCKTIMGLLPKPARITGGSICLCGRELVGLTDRQYCGVRGADISMVFQDPLVSLDPSYTIGTQITEAIRIHAGNSASAASDAGAKDSASGMRAKVISLMKDVGIDRAEERIDAYPWMLSGGMRQRCVLAMALAQEPRLLIADEPTTALDVTIQTEILDLLRDLARTRNLSVLFITHDLGACARIADRINIMYSGKIIETGTAEDILQSPAHPYTKGLLRALPALSKDGRLHPIPGAPLSVPEGFAADAFAYRNEQALGIDFVQAPPFFELSPTHQVASWLADPRAPKISECVPAGEIAADAVKGPAAGNSTPADPQALEVSEGRQADKGDPLLRVRHLSHSFRLGRKAFVKAVDDVSFDIRPGETFALVGESGSGKSTLARCLLGMIRPDSGQISYDGFDIAGKRLPRDLKMRLAREIQFISQDPGAALDPRMTVRDIIAEPLMIHHMFSDRRSLESYIRSMLREVQLDENLLDRTPGQLSGGQRQRVSIARAYGMDPKLLIADEPLSSLDVSIQAQIIELFIDLRKKHRTSLLLISHDLSMVRLISDRVGVMFKGQMVETGETERLFQAPDHPYTRTLISSIPVPDPSIERDRRVVRYEEVTE